MSIATPRSHLTTTYGNWAIASSPIPTRSSHQIHALHIYTKVTFHLPQSQYHHTCTIPIPIPTTRTPVPFPNPHLHPHYNNVPGYIYQPSTASPQVPYCSRSLYSKEGLRRSGWSKRKVMCYMGHAGLAELAGVQTVGELELYVGCGG